MNLLMIDSTIYTTWNCLLQGVPINDRLFIRGIIVPAARISLFHEHATIKLPL